MEQILGLITGLAFGFLLQKGRVLRYEKQVGAMLFKDMTIFKFMLSAIIVGMFGILAMADMGIINLSHKAMNVGGVVVGGALFGIGWAIMGFCPGTAMGAIGEGRWHAIFALIGMMLGAAIYAEIFPAVNDTILSWANFGKISLPDVLGVNQWIVAIVFTAICLALFRLFEKKGV
ncbi:MAG: YeeE/YedE family protein [Burkholderiaceae bacterium]|nr:YeeE/YedE family protein [Burkholderiaceae bacterium]